MTQLSLPLFPTRLFLLLPFFPLQLFPHHLYPRLSSFSILLSSLVFSSHHLPSTLLLFSVSPSSSLVSSKCLLPVSFHLFTLLTPRPLPHSLFDLPLIWSLTLLFPFRLLLLLLNLIFYFLILFLFLHFLLIFFHISSLFTLTLLSKYKSLFNSSVFVLLPWCFFLSFFLFFHVILLTSLSCCFFILLSSPNVFIPFPHICSSSPVFTFFYFLLFFPLPPRCGPSLLQHTRTLTSFPPTI